MEVVQVGADLTKIAILRNACFRNFPKTSIPRLNRRNKSFVIVSRDIIPKPLK